MSDDEKYKAEARQAWRDSRSQDNEGGVDSVGFIVGYVEGRKKSEGEISRLKIENLNMRHILQKLQRDLGRDEHVDGFWMKDLFPEAQKIQDRDQRITEMNALFVRISRSYQEELKDRDERIAELEAENQEVKRWLNVSRMLNGELRALVEEIQDRFETCNYISGFFFEWEQKVTAILNNDKGDEV